MPELNLHCLRLASNSPKVRDTLLKLDEQGVSESEPMITHGREAFGTTVESSKDVFTEGQSGNFRDLSIFKWRFWKGILFSQSLFSPVGVTKDFTMNL